MTTAVVMVVMAAVIIYKIVSIKLNKRTRALRKRGIVRKITKQPVVGIFTAPRLVIILVLLLHQ